MINAHFNGMAGEYVFDYEALNALAEREALKSRVSAASEWSPATWNGR